MKYIRMKKIKYFYIPTSDKNEKNIIQTTRLV